MDATANGQITQLTLEQHQRVDADLVAGRPDDCLPPGPLDQLWVMPADGSALPVELTAAFSSGFNLLATSWSVIEVGQGRGRRAGQIR